MKKILLLIVCLFALGTGISRADLISPQAEAQAELLKDLPEEERLKQCQELDSLKRGNRYRWRALGCNELMQKKVNQENTDTPAPEVQTPVETTTVGTGAQGIEKQPAELFGTKVQTKLQVNPPAQTEPQTEPQVQIEPQAEPQVQNQSAQPAATPSKSDKIRQARSYLKIAKIALLLLSAAFVLVWRMRKT